MLHAFWQLEEIKQPSISCCTEYVHTPLDSDAPLLQLAHRCTAGCAPLVQEPQVVLLQGVQESYQ